MRTPEERKQVSGVKALMDPFEVIESLRFHDFLHEHAAAHGRQRRALPGVRRLVPGLVQALLDDVHQRPLLAHAWVCAEKRFKTKISE